MRNSSWLAEETQHSLMYDLRARRSTWLVTGAAGFIGSNLIESLLLADQSVVGLDNFSTGHRRNLREIEQSVGAQKWENFRLLEADIRDRAACFSATKDIDYVLHQAALGSVPRSIADPLTTHEVNVTGFVNMLDAARRNGVKRFIYAASSSTYGDEPTLPQREERIGNPLSPYAVSKLANEIYAGVYARVYGFASIGLRYFNVFGPRQDPNGAYAAVIPKWAAAMIEGQDVAINGDGSTSRDFCYVSNAVQANIRAALAGEGAQNEVYNIALGHRTSLNELFEHIRGGLERRQLPYRTAPVFLDFRAGDVRHSQADISKACSRLGYRPTHPVAAGIEEALPWYINFFRSKGDETEAVRL